jgi:NADH-quinone oxidoreductase subunit E
MIAEVPARPGPRKWLYRPDALEAEPPPELAALLVPYRGRADALMTVLEEIQNHYGYLPRTALRHAARVLRMPLSRVFGVATFYNLFRFDPPGRYLVRCCQGTACHVNGGAAILARVRARLGIAENETTPEGSFTLQTVACIGACSLAPVMTVGDRVHGRMTPDLAVATLDALARAATETP